MLSPPANPKLGRLKMEEYEGSREEQDWEVRTESILRQAEVCIPFPKKNKWGHFRLLVSFNSVSNPETKTYYAEEILQKSRRRVRGNEIIHVRCFSFFFFF